MDPADLELFTRSVRAACEHSARGDVDAALAELGWRDALDDDPRAAVSVLFEAQGETNATSSALAWVLGTDVLPPISPRLSASPRLLPNDSALGASEGPRAPGWAPPGRVHGGRLHVEGLALGPLGDDVRVAATSADGDVVVTVPAAALSTPSVEGLDPRLGLLTVQADAAVYTSCTSAHRPAWDGAVGLGRIALGHELVGASRTMLRLAREHALERVQFDRPIAQFQAVRHRLAETLVAIETAAAALDAAWLDASPRTAAMAKAVAGRAGRTAARHCQQVLAGIGFTTEHPLHRYVRRVLVLDQLLGASRTLTADLGDELLTSRRLPPLLPL